MHPPKKSDKRQFQKKMRESRKNRQNNFLRSTVEANKDSTDYIHKSLRIIKEAYPNRPINIRGLNISLGKEADPQKIKKVLEKLVQLNIINSQGNGAYSFPSAEGQRQLEILVYASIPYPSNPDLSLEILSKLTHLDTETLKLYISDLKEKSALLSYATCRINKDYWTT